MKRLGLLVSVSTLALLGFASDEFGKLDSVMADHPDFFKPGVREALLGDEPWYVYTGEAEKCFDEETESELFEEAEVQAKMSFFEHFCEINESKDIKVDVTQARTMYKTVSGNMRYAVLGVPKKNVTVSKLAPVPTASASVGTDEANAAPVPEKPAPATDAPAKADAPADKSARDKSLEVLRRRIKENPNNFNARIRMARIFAKEGNVKRALRNYADGAKMMVRDVLTSDEIKAPALKEIAEYEEANGAGALALKHYRVLQRMRDREHSAYATGKISQLLLRYR